VTGEECRPLLDDDGQVIASVRGTHPLSEEAEAAMRDLVATAKRMWESDPDHAEMLARQDASRERIRARWARLRGETS
jgi:hypothetical protein